MKKRGKGDSQDTLKSFSDFLEKCLVIDPVSRMTVEEAVSHPFLGLI